VLVLHRLLLCCCLAAFACWCCKHTGALRLLLLLLLLLALRLLLAVLFITQQKACSTAVSTRLTAAGAGAAGVRLPSCSSQRCCDGGQHALPLRRQLLLQLRWRHNADPDRQLRQPLLQALLRRARCWCGVCGCCRCSSAWLLCWARWLVVCVLRVGLLLQDGLGRL
jgi:hypothetical protein